MSADTRAILSVVRAARVYRRKSASVICASSGVVSLVAISLPAVIGPGSAEFRAVFVPLGVVFAAWCFRAAYAYVKADAIGVLVVNPIRRHRIEWREISEFALERWGLLPRQGTVHLHDGNSVATWAISGKNPGLHRSDPIVEEMVQDLNTRLRESKL
jgi:hypothetical protein